MCGIFGLSVSSQSKYDKRLLQSFTNLLFELSESRGKEAAGLAVASESGIHIHKDAIAATEMIKTKRYQAFWDALPKDEPLTIIGHSRLVTNGLQGLSKNNQPVAKSGIIGVHNGIIVNDKQLWSEHPELEREGEVDTEVLLALIAKQLQQSFALPKAISNVFQALKGSASTAFLFETIDCLALATNTGSLYYSDANKQGALCFTSESLTLEQFNKRTQTHFTWSNPTQLKPHQGLVYALSSRKLSLFTMAGEHDHPALQLASIKRTLISDERLEIRREKLKRCTKCILPETFPGISFDTTGVCSVCRDYKQLRPKGKEALITQLESMRRDNGKPDCLVAFSGGRDSSYMLHYVVNELGLNPITYSYDWGMVTDIARRNQARMTGQLGIELIYISADIRKKRRAIQMNIKAWLKKPSLGMIPLFMAGDKQYFYYAQQIQKDYALPVTFLGGNPLERTGFKTGFTGVKEEGGRTYEISAMKKMRLLSYYGKQFVTNPAYLNPSLLDTAHAYYSSYVMPHNFLWLFHYIPWEERLIDETLAREYDWETAADTKNTWRIGDGTAAFYNYIYYTVAGFTENDTFRSNQIREGMITREAALQRAIGDNQPRYDSMRQYAHQVGFDLDEALQVINSMEKLY